MLAAVTIPVVSVDVPRYAPACMNIIACRLVQRAYVVIPPLGMNIPKYSGWDVERGDVSTESTGLRPDMLVSLSAPKLCARHFTGRHHYLGGRFIPGVLAERFALDLPVYPGASQTVRLSRQE